MHPFVKVLAGAVSFGGTIGNLMESLRVSLLALSTPQLSLGERGSKTNMFMATFLTRMLRMWKSIPLAAIGGR